MLCWIILLLLLLLRLPFFLPTGHRDRESCSSDQQPSPVFLVFGK